MKTTTHTTQHGRTTCEDILAKLNDDALQALETWRRLTNLDSTYLGGRGRTREQMSVAARAWDELPPAAQNAYFAMLSSVVYDIADAIRDVGVPDAEREIDAIEALLGPDHPAFRVLPAYALVDAYREALEQVAD